MSTITVTQPGNHLLKYLFAVKIAHPLVRRQKLFYAFNLRTIIGIIFWQRQNRRLFSFLELLRQGLRFTSRALAFSTAIGSVFCHEYSFLPPWAAALQGGADSASSSYQNNLWHFRRCTYLHLLLAMQYRFQTFVCQSWHTRNCLIPLISFEITAQKIKQAEHPGWEDCPPRMYPKCLACKDFLICCLFVKPCRRVG